MCRSCCTACRCLWRAAFRPGRAHPRARGDVSTTRTTRHLRPGSPPRARGHPNSQRSVRRGAGAHPRVRGDIPGRPRRCRRSGGSPPRARGHLGGGPVDVRLLGLTPACAGTSRRWTGRCTPARAHPRVRGDIIVGDSFKPRDRGSLTPACAGTSRRWTGRCTPARAHPRVRGDISAVDRSMYACSGSPPRARGHHRRRQLQTPRQGLTHPRVRGDILSDGAFRLYVSGSPPRARGHLGGGPVDVRLLGLTPACAGTSCLTALSGCMCRAHPRVRGDIGWEPAYDTVVAGSPPRARGHRDHCDADAALPGLTPACAGTSVVFRKSSARRRAHPRVRGDIRDIERHDCAGTDSSPPRARGRPPRRQHARIGGGLTPACAGTSAQYVEVLTLLAGSPPRARGRRVLGVPEHDALGLTPACAGTSQRLAGPVDDVGAHPRVRGDVRSSLPPRPTPWAHPRVRGDIDDLVRSAASRGGLTPACAGTSYPAAQIARAKSGSPPRARGRLIGCSAPHRRLGSPPRARGRRRRRRPAVRRRGLTPACAGTSHRWRSPS